MLSAPVRLSGPRSLPPLARQARTTRIPRLSAAQVTIKSLRNIRKYLEIHKRAPAEHEMQAFFGTSPPAVHRMVIVLAKKGLITREPGVARSIQLAPGAGASEDEIAAVGSSTRPPNEITEPLDPPIAPLVEALCSDARILTKGSCWGHGKKPAYIDLAVEGIEGLRLFVERLNVVDRRFRDEAFFEMSLNWSDGVVTSCAFDVFPNWIMLSWMIEGSGRRGAPSAQLLANIAQAYMAASRQRAKPRRSS